jgi:hypothetical protein
MFVQFWCRKIYEQIKRRSLFISWVLKTLFLRLNILQIAPDLSKTTPFL